MPNPFITTQDLTDLLGRNVTADPGALIAIDAACDICRDVMEKSFNAGTATISLDGTDTDALVLPEWPVTRAGTVTVNGVAETAFTVTPDGLLFRGTAGANPRTAWPAGRQNIRLTYEYGYDTVTIPRSVKMVALQLASRIVVQGVAKSEAIGETSVTYAAGASDLTPSEERILRRHRRTRSF